MAIQTYVEVSADDVVRGMMDDPEFAMDILAGLADRMDESDFAEGDSGSLHHSEVAPYLDRVAQALRDGADT